MHDPFALALGSSLGLSDGWNLFIDVCPGRGVDNVLLAIHCKLSKEHNWGWSLAVTHRRLSTIFAKTHEEPLAHSQKNFLSVQKWTRSRQPDGYIGTRLSVDVTLAQLRHY